MGFDKDYFTLFMRKFLDKYKNHIKDNEIFKNVEKACKTYELSKIQEKNFSTCFLNPVEYEIFISFLQIIDAAPQPDQLRWDLVYRHE